MEIIQTDIVQTKSLPLQSTEGCHFVGCCHHELSFVIDAQGQLYSLQDENPRKLSMKGSIVQIVKACSKDSDSCQAFIRSNKNSVYQWKCQSKEHVHKRVKLNNLDGQVEKIAENITNIISYDQTSVVLFPSNCDKPIQIYNFDTKEIVDTTQFSFDDVNISHCQVVGNLDASITDFFNIHDHGMIYAKNSFVLWRSSDRQQDIELFTLNECMKEEVMLLEFICVPELSTKLNACLVIGDQGTIVFYIKDKDEPGSLILKQFDISGPINAIIKMKDLTYIVSNGSTTSLLQIDDHDFDLQSIPLNNGSNTYKLNLMNAGSLIFDALLKADNDQIQWSRMRYNPEPKSIENDPQAIKALIEASLKELAQSEESLRLMEAREKELSQKLTSTNYTLYALKNIQSKRKLGVINSLDTTGFEFTVRPVLKSNSSENCCLQTATYLRVCIKTSRFLELEHWDLSIDLYSPFTKTGQSKLISVIGFESQYDNGIEKSIIWERDVAIDIRHMVLPLEVSTALIMTLNSEIIRFPLSEMTLDDLHFVKPCSSNIQTSIERRGLDEISNKLIKAYHLQILHDRSRAYPVDTLIEKYKPDESAMNSFLFRHKSIRLQYKVEPTLSDEKYRSILGNLLCEGLSSDDAKNILRNGAEQAMFFLAAHPHSPVIIHLSKHSPGIIEFSIQCAYPPALLKVEASLQKRISDCFMESLDASQRTTDVALMKKLRTLEKHIIELQDQYQDQRNDSNRMDIDTDSKISFSAQLMSAIDLHYDIHANEPLGYLNIS